MKQILCEGNEIKISGVVSFANVMQIYADFCQVIGTFGHEKISVNLSALECVDSSVISCLVLAMNHASSLGKAISYISYPPKLLQIIKLCGLDYLVK